MEFWDGREASHETNAVEMPALRSRMGGEATDTRRYEADCGGDQIA
jgi:hypothetical protein